MENERKFDRFLLISWLRKELVKSLLFYCRSRVLRCWLTWSTWVDYKPLYKSAACSFSMRFSWLRSLLVPRKIQPTGALRVHLFNIATWKQLRAESSQKNYWPFWHLCNSGIYYKSHSVYWHIAGRNYHSISLLFSFHFILVLKTNFLDFYTASSEEFPYYSYYQ